MPTITSGSVTLLDLTDSKKIDLHITSNHPTVQISDQNISPAKLTPDWSQDSLILTPIIYIDSAPVENDSSYSFTWDKIDSSGKIDEGIFKSKVLTVSDNDLNNSATMRYKCTVTTKSGQSFSNEITFARVYTGKDGTNGTDGYTPQKGVDYFDGIDGKDGTSVTIEGVAYSKTTPVTGRSIVLYSDTTTTQLITGTATGESYLVNGYLCVFNADINQFICTGQIQGPQGQKGDSYYLFIRYADNANGGGISVYPTGKTYIGFYRSSVNQVPTDVSATIWNWAKFVGDNAKTVNLTANAQVFKVSKDGVVSPPTITITAQAENTTVTSWYYNLDGSKNFINIADTRPVGVSEPSNGTITITGSAMTSNLITIKASDGNDAHSDIFTIYKVSDGTDGLPGDEGTPASIVFLSNENMSFAANSSGQVASTTVYCNVVAYNGTTKVTPELGTITGLPTGMSVTAANITTVSNEKVIPIVIANNATLGSSNSISGAINIPIISPVATTLKLNWSKINTGAPGVGIKSTTVTYGVSDSASTKPEDIVWQSTVPVVGEGKYLWTCTIIDYTDDTIQDTVTYTYAKQGVKGDTGSPGSPVTVSSIQYQSGTSGTVAPTGAWSTNVVSVTEGNYLWTKTAFSDGNIAYGVARQGKDGVKGNAGRGISSIVEEYYQSTSATTQSGGSWSTTVPTWADGKYIWTRSVITYTDLTSATTSPVCITGQKGATGGIGASGIGISSVDVWYYQSSSATSLSGGSWATTAPTWVDGKYIWTKTITTYTNSTTDETNAVCITGQKGSTGVGIKSVTEYYLATASSSGVTTSTSGWTTAIQTISADKKYLWNYEVITYTDNTTSTTSPIIIGAFGNTGTTGKGIKSVTEYYLATALSSGVTTSTTGWTTTMQALTATNKYLWNYELITYTDDSKTTINPVIIGVYGDKGAQGDRGAGISSVTVTYGMSKDVSTQPTSWQTTIPTVDEGSYLWTRTVTDYTDTSIADTVTLTYAKQGAKGSIGSAGTSVTVSSIQYQAGSSATTAPTGTWSNSVVTVAEGSYLWTKTTFSDGKIAYGVAKQGASGAPGTPASLVDITPSAMYFKSTTGKDGTFTPEYIYLYPRFQNATYSNWQYSIDGGVNWVAASGANGLTVSTYSSIANTLRISRASTLYTDSITSISFRCNSATSGVYDTISIAKIYDVVDLEIGGRNYIRNSEAEWVTPGISSSSAYGVYQNNLNSIFEQLAGKALMVSFEAKIETTNNTLGQIRVYGSNGSPKYQIGSKNFTNIAPNQWQRFTSPIDITYNDSNTGEGRIEFYGNNATTTKIYIRKFKLEIGNKATDWTPAPEDVNANIETLTKSIVDVKTTANSAESRVSETEKSITTINNNITSIADKVSAAEQKITADAIVSTVTKSTTYTNDLGKKVNSTEIISKINQTAETITISASKIGILGATNIPDLTADKIKGGTLTLGGSSAATQNGQILVKDSSDADMVKMNKDGIFVESGKLSIAQDVDGRIAYDEATDQYYPTTNTSILELKDNEITMGIKGLTTNVRLSSLGLNLGGHIQGFGGYGSYIGNRTIGSAIPLVVQDNVQSDIRFLGASDVELARLTVNGFSIGGTDERSIVFANAGSNNGQAKIYKGSSSSSTVLGVWDDANNRAVMRYLTDGTLFLDRPVNFGMGIQNKSRVLWSGMISSGNITLADAYTNYSFLTCIIGTTTITEGTTLGAFYDIDQNELHFGSIFTGHNGLAGENLYGAIFTVPNMSNRSVINLARCGTKTTSGYYVKKIMAYPSM